MTETANRTAATGARETPADIWIVDADVHVHEDPAELAEYAAPPWDVALREIAKVEERYLDLPAMSPRAEFRIPWPGGSNRPQVVESAAAMRRELDTLHVNEAVLFPDHLLSLAMVRDPAFAVALARAYNDWLADRWLRDEPTLRGAVVIPPQDPVAGAEEIRKHAADPGYVCAYLPASGLKTLYGHELYDPVYDAAQETGLPLAIHSVEAIFPVFPFQLEQFRTALAVHSLAHPLAMVANLVSMLETGVPVRFPGARLAFMEAGTGWVPWIANRLDKEYIERRREVPILQERPERVHAALLLRHAADRGARAPRRHRQAVRAVRRREHRDLRLGLAAPRLRPHAVRVRAAVLAGGAPEDHGAERRAVLRSRPARMSREPVEHPVGAVRDIPPGSHRIVRVGNRELGVFNIRGELHAIPNLCPHQRGPLCAGGVSGTIDQGPRTDWKLAWIWDGRGRDVPLARARVPHPDGTVRRVRRHPAADVRGARVATTGRSGW